MAKKTELTGRQKAAIFLVSLGSDVSSEIFKHLREDEIEQLTFEIARLDKIEPEDRDRVLQEFQEMMMAQEFISNGASTTLATYWSGRWERRRPSTS
jgi:flagellar motor switch protein FliG